MGLLDKIMPRRRRAVEAGTVAGYRTVTEYQPVFTPYDGGIYGQALTRAAIDRIATACSKLTPSVEGSAKPRIRAAIESSPNEFMTWSKFLYKSTTVLYNDTTLCIVPVFGDDLQTVTGIYPLKFSTAEIVDYGGTPWVRFYTATGEVRAMELENTCFISRYQYESDFFGSENVLDSTMALINAQNQAQEAAIKNGATIKFIGSVNGMMKDEDIKKKREKFTEDNLSSANTSGLMIYDNTFSNIEQVDPKHYVIDASEMEQIRNEVYSYFGVNEDIMQSKFNENTWDAFYESCIEPVAVQLGDGLTKMLYTQREIKAGNSITFSASRLAYSSNASKRNMIRDMVDRGIMSMNEARQVLQLPPMPDGDKFIIRGEYIDLSLLSEHTVQDALAAKKGTDSGETDREVADEERGLFDADAKGQNDEPDNDENERK